MPAAALRGLNRLTFDGIAGLVDVVEAIHHNIAGTPGRHGLPTVSNITRLVYRSVRTVAGVVGQGLDHLIGGLTPVLNRATASRGREASQAVLNGVLGDYLARTSNPLAISMQFRREGRSLPMDAQGLAAAIPNPGTKLVVLVHGLCMNDRQWNRNGHDHGAALARDLGYTPVYLHYNSGLHISTNGRALAALLETLVKRWPVPIRELALIGHSMGGLVSRSACHYGAEAGHAWRRRLRHLVFLGTPHHGAPLERGGNWVHVLLDKSPYVAPLARLGRIRSAGITDLRHGNLLDADWQGRDRFEHTGDRRRAVPLPQGVACYTLAATTGQAGGLRSRLVGDGIVPLESALGRHDDPARELSFPPSRTWIGHGMRHLDLLSGAAAYTQIKRWLGRSSPARRAARGRRLPRRTQAPTAP